MLPHKYPFAFVDPVPPASSEVGENRVVLVRLTQGAGPFRGAPAIPSILAIEMIAQASAVLMAGSGSSPAEASTSLDVGSQMDPGEGASQNPGTPSSKPVHLAGFEATFSQNLADEPMIAGDDLEIRIEDSRAFGRLHKVTGGLLRIRSDDSRELLVEAELMLSK